MAEEEHLEGYLRAIGVNVIAALKLVPVLVSNTCPPELLRLMADDDEALAELGLTLKEHGLLGPWLILKACLRKQGAA